MVVKVCVSHFQFTRSHFSAAAAAREEVRVDATTAAV